MKTSFFKLRNLTGALLLSLTCTAGFSQVHIGINGSRIISESANWGGGVFVKGFLGNNVSLGAAVNVYPKHLSSETVKLKGVDYRKSQGNLYIPVTGMLDIYLTKTGFRPYIGTDIGLYYTSNFYRIDDDTNGNTLLDNRSNKSYFGVGPHFGFAIESGLLGVFAKVQYNYMFGSGKDGELIVPTINAPVTTNAAKSFTSLDLGIYLRLVSE